MQRQPSMVTSGRAARPGHRLQRAHRAALFGFDDAGDRQADLFVAFRPW
jgi:hypothetical protein